MRIAVSAKGRQLNDQIDMRFGRAEYFVIVDEKGQLLDVMDNAAQSATGGAGIAAAQSILDAGIDILITGQLGPNAMRITESASLPAYQAVRGTVAENIEAYAKNELSRISESGPAHAGQR